MQTRIISRLGRDNNTSNPLLFIVIVLLGENRILSLLTQTCSLPVLSSELRSQAQCTAHNEIYILGDCSSIIATLRSGLKGQL